MRARRLLFVAVTALVFSMAMTALLTPVPDQGERNGDRAQPSPATSPAPGAAPAEGVDAPIVLSVDRTDQRVEVPLGRALRLQVRADEATDPIAVQVGEDGPVEYAATGTPAEFALFGVPGLDDPVTVLESGRVIGRVVAGDER